MKMTIRQWLPLIGIVISVFIFNTSEFMPVALLTDIAKDFDVSEATAGMIISVYAWVVAILSLPLMLAFRKMEYRRMLLIMVALFMVFQVVSALSYSYGMLMVARLGVACAHAVFWSIASPLAVSVVPREYRSLALSAVVTGTSVAMIVGLPLGRVIGLALGWRMTFAAVAVMALVALVLLIATFPRVENEGTFKLGDLSSIFRNKVLMCIYVVIVLLVVGYYTGYSYIEPFLGQVAGLSEGMITVALTVFGVAGIIGSLLFSRYYNDHTYPFIGISIVAVAISLVLLGASSVSVISVMVLFVFWGMFMTAFNVAFQSETIKSSPHDGTAIAMSLFSGLFNLGIGTGTMIGGVVCDNLSISYIGYVGGAFALVASVICIAVLFRLMRKRDSKAESA